VAAGGGVQAAVLHVWLGAACDAGHSTGSQGDGAAWADHAQRLNGRSIRCSAEPARDAALPRPVPAGLVTLANLQVETVNGDIHLTRIDATTVSATTVNGEIEYDGTIKNNGRYSFASHNGDVSVSVPEDANLTVSVSTYQGEFESCFPITLQQIKPQHRFSFTMGSGGGRLEVESFQGDIRLCPSGQSGRTRVRPKHDKNDHDEDHQ